MVESLIRPSFKLRFARGSLSMRPNLWNGLRWAFNGELGNTGITIREVSGRKRNTIIQSGALWVRGGVNCLTSGFDGEPIPDITGDKFTIIMGLQPHWSSGEATSHFLFDGDLGNANQFRLIWLSSQEWRFRIHTSAGSINLDIGDSFSAEEKFQMEFVYDGTNKFIYHNAILLNSVGQTGTVDNDGGTNKAIGVQGDLSTEPLNGVIRYFYLYDRVLLVNERLDILANPNAMFQFADRAIGRVAVVADTTILTLPVKNYMRNLITR